MLEPLFGLAVPGYCRNMTAHRDGRDPLLLKIQRPLSKVTKTEISHTFKQSYTNENLIMEKKIFMWVWTVDFWLWKVTETVDVGKCRGRRF